MLSSPSIVQAHYFMFQPGVLNTNLNMSDSAQHGNPISQTFDEWTLVASPMMRSAFSSLTCKACYSCGRGLRGIDVVYHGLINVDAVAPRQLVCVSAYKTEKYSWPVLLDGTRDCWNTGETHVIRMFPEEHAMIILTELACTRRSTDVKGSSVYFGIITCTCAESTTNGLT